LDAATAKVQALPSALSRFAACSDEMLVPRGKEVSTLVAYGPRRRTEHQFVEQIAVAVPNPDRDNFGARRRPPGSAA
jgi:hypothetical protein